MSPVLPSLIAVLAGNGSNAGWLHENIPWIFSGAGVAVLGALYALYQNWNKRRRNPLKQIKVQPIHELTHVPDAGEGKAVFQFGLRFTNAEEATVMISALQVRHYVGQAGVEGIWPVQICTFNPITLVAFPATFPGHSVADLIFSFPEVDNTARSLCWNLDLYAFGKRSSSITIELFRDGPSECEVSVDWQGVRALMGMMNIPPGQQTVDVKFRKKMKNADYLIQTKVFPPSSTPPEQ